MDNSLVWDEDHLGFPIGVKIPEKFDYKGFDKLYF